MPDHEARGRAVYDHDNEEPRPAGRRRRQVADWGVGEELFDGMPGRRFERRPHQDIPRGNAGDGRRTIVIETADDEPVEVPPRAEEEFATRDEALRARERHDELWAGDEPFADEREPAPTESWAAGDEPFADEREPAPAESWAAGDEALADEREAAAEAWVDREAGSSTAWAADDERGVAASAEDRWAADEAWAAGSDVAVADEVAPAPRDDGIVRGGQAGRRTVKIGGRPAEFHGTPARARRRPPRTVHERVGARPERIAAWAFALGILLILIAIATANA